MNKHKIWLLLDSSKSGGIESHVQQLAEGLLQFDQDVEVILLSDYGEHPMHQSLSKAGVTYRVLDGKITSLYKHLKKDRPTVVHTHGYKAGIFGRITAWLNNIPSISTFHAGEVATGKMAIYDYLDRMSARLASKVFAVSPQIAKRLPLQAEVFKNFINNTQLITSKGEQIAFVGRVSHEKGPDHFMSLAQSFIDIDFHLYGDGPMLPIIEQEKSANLHLHGQQDDMQQVWPNIGLLVICSRFEGLPMAALEAMARGIPVIAYDVGALNQLIQPEYNGWLIQPDNINALSQQLDTWLSLPKKKKQVMALACEHTINEAFSSQIAIPQLIKNYHGAQNQLAT